MAAKYIRYIIGGFIALLVQWMLQPVIAIGGIGPNFLVIFIIALALQFGPLCAVWTALVMGLVNDALTAANLLGLTAFCLAVTGYIAAQFKDQLNRITPVFQYVILLGIIIIFYVVNDFVYHQGLDWRFITLLWSHILPAAFYTFVVLFFVFAMTHFGEE